jgi:hypothetical protein
MHLKYKRWMIVQTFIHNNFENIFEEGSRLFCNLL